MIALEILVLSRMLSSLDGKKVVITGASSGLGLSFAKTLAEFGADLVLLARRVDRLEFLANDISRLYGVEVLPVKCDISVEKDIIDAVHSIKKRFQRVDVLINNAGVACRFPAEDLTLELWNKTMATNLTGTFVMSKHIFSNFMKLQRSGSIINVSSIAAFKAPKDRPTSAYGASKAAVVALTKHLAAEWGKYNVRVNSLAPGYFPSEMTESIYNDEYTRKKLESRTILKRLGFLKELSGIIVYLVSDSSSYLTGQTLVVDGGWLAM